MKVRLAFFQGNILKTATIESNDPDNPAVLLQLRGQVTALISLKPSGNLLLKGSVGELPEGSVDLVATTTPFHIKSIDTNLKGNIRYSLQTVSQGTRYRLKVADTLKQGNYSGFIRLNTDLPQAPCLLVNVTGIITGKIAATPETVIVGKLSADKPVRSGGVTITSNDDRPFRITGLTYDKRLLAVSPEKARTGKGFLLDIQPRLDEIRTGSVKQTHLGVETSAGPNARADVLVIIFNNSKNR